MIYTTIKTVVLTILLIIIIHLLICYLLMNERKKKVHFKLDNEIFSSTANNIEQEHEQGHEHGHEQDNENENDKSNDFDINLLKKDLMKYISSNKEIYKEDKSTNPEPNSNCVNQSESNFSDNNSGISQYFKNTVDTNDISLYNEPTEKQTYIDDTPQIVSKTKKPIHNDLNNWKYTNENVMNGGEFSNGLVGYETIDGQFATL